MRVRRTLTALFAASCLLSGCGGTSSAADPPLSGSPTSPAPTTHPPAHESPQHFIRRWADAERRMENTGRTRQYLSLSDGCHACSTLARTISKYYAAGGFVDWAGWRIETIKAYPSNSDGIAFAVHSQSAPTTYRESSEQPAKVLAGGSITYVLQLEPKTDPFHVTSKAQLNQ
jgi:hypothetical protein